MGVCEAPFGHVEFWGTGSSLSGLQLHSTLLECSAYLSPGDSELRQIVLATVDYLTDPSSPLPLPPAQIGTPFQKAVWSAIRDIPLGQTRSYAEIAGQLSSHPRAVARACGLNPFPLLTPCHRVVASRGLGGFMQSELPEALSIKSWLLAHEVRGFTPAGS